MSTSRPSSRRLFRPSPFLPLVLSVLCLCFWPLRAARVTPELLETLQNLADPCRGRRIFTLPLPEKFNKGLLYNSTRDGADLFKEWWTYDMVKHIKAASLNSGFGSPLHKPILGLPALQNAWYHTDQNSLENIFYARMVSYGCRVDNHYEADMIYVPYFGGHDSLRTMHMDERARDQLPLELVHFLKAQPSWRRRGGADHFMVLGRNVWDFHRHGGGTWGSRLLSWPGIWNNMWTVVVETFPGVPKVVSAPKPTSFHPTTQKQVKLWQKHIRGRERKSLFTFVGGHRGLDTEEGVLREKLFWQCQNSKHCSLVDCSVVSDKWERCSDINQFFSYYASAVFCLHPMGDACSRRSVLDAALAGCIPVVFKSCTLEDQFQWHLGKEKDSLFVHIPMTDIKGPVGLNTSQVPYLEGGDVWIEDVLKAVPEKQRVAMRNHVISLIPRLIYGGRLEEDALVAPDFKDSVDVIVDGLQASMSSAS